MILNLICILIVGISSLIGKNIEKNYSSKAYNKADGKFIYSELHRETFNDERIIESVTRYTDPNNKILSQRIMKFPDDLLKPEYELNDFRSGYREGSELLPDKKVKVYTREAFNGPLKEKILTVEEPFVIDGGLTYFFVKNWDRLINDETIQFNFIAPAKLDYYKFRVSKSGITTVGGRKGLKLKLEINNLILRQFVSPIYITYALDNKEIL